MALQEGKEENTHSHSVNHCLPRGCDTLERLAGGRSSRDCTDCTQTAKPAPMPGVSSSVGAEAVSHPRERIQSLLSSCLCAFAC